MKSKKAVKRLTRIETLLSDVLDQYSVIEKNVREALLSAKASVVSAREFASVRAASEVRQKAAKGRKPGQRHLDEAKSKAKPSVRAKKRSSQANAAVNPKAVPAAKNPAYRATASQQHEAKKVHIFNTAKSKRLVKAKGDAEPVKKTRNKPA